MKFFTLFFFFVLGTAAHATARVAPIFSSGAVLQRGANCPVWGTADSGEVVTVTFSGQSKTTAACAGHWRVDLDAMPANSTPQPLTVQGMTNTVTLSNILIGDVWIGTGQSNMSKTVTEFRVNDPALAALADASYPLIRLNPGVARDDARWEESGWQQATSVLNNRFSAHLFSFGVQLQQQLNVPVGLIVRAMGGTAANAWVDETALLSDADFIAANKTYELSAGAMPTGWLYEGLVLPVAPYAVCGVLYDQGEQGTGLKNHGFDAVLPALIRGWRRDFENPNLPFVIAEKPSGGGCAFDYGDPVTFRADAFAALPAKPPVLSGPRLEFRTVPDKVSGVAIVELSDVGSGTHPLNKWGAGNRSAQTALRAFYGFAGPVNGPAFASFAIEGNAIRVSYKPETLGAGLASMPSTLQGFAVAGIDGKFYWCNSCIIDGATVVVSSTSVAAPVKVQYGGITHAWANLFNSEGLPAVPFVR